MKNLNILFLFVLIYSTSFAQTKQINVHFEVFSSNISDSSNIYIVGSNSTLGNWNPGEVKLNKLGNGKYFINLLFNQNQQIEYKFTKGNWQLQALNENGTIPGNYNLTVKNDTSIIHNINNWAKRTPPPAFKEQITGTVNYHRQMPYDGLQPRDVFVWLPYNYELDKNKHYPVLYMHDGQNIFNPQTASFGYDWQIDETADSLIKQGKIPPFIIVGINNTPDRMLEYTNSDLGYKYMKYIVEDLKPFIDSTYRTLKNRDNCYTGGSSAGGLISFMLLWEYNNIFSKALCFSPAFKIEELDYVTTVYNTKEKKDIKVYIANGGKNLEERLQPGITEMINLLEEKGYQKNKDFWFNKFEEDDHSEKSWAKRIPQYFLLMFGK
ncbi:MAG: alpha/beta hydrolase-fold protein [bacterium]